MALDLSCLLITPRSLLRSRTGGIIARLLSRTDLDLIGARMFAFTGEEAERLAEAADDGRPGSRLIADCVRAGFPPGPDGRGNRVMALLFRGGQAVEQLRRVTGDLPGGDGVPRGVTLRDTYAETPPDAADSGAVRLYDPVALTPGDAGCARRMLELLAEFADSRGNLIDHSAGSGAEDQRTLVIIKPENWRSPSSRPGAIIDMLSRTGLRIVGCKIHHMTTADAMKFYGPVRDALRAKLAPKAAARARAILEEEFRLRLPDGVLPPLEQSVGTAAADEEFFRLIEFMSGARPDGSPQSAGGSAKCLVLVYEGTDAVARIRAVLGPTDPARAPGGTVRGDFGGSVMVNAAHASDSPASYEREAALVDVGRNSFAELIRTGLNA